MQRLLILFFLTVFVPTVLLAQAGVTVHIDKGGIDIQPDALLSYYQAPLEKNLWLQEQKIAESQWPLLFEIARAGNTTLDNVWQIRQEVSSWQEVLNSLKIPTAYFYYDVSDTQHLPPPYGKAYGYFRNHPSETVNWQDQDLINLASVKFIADSKHIPVHEAVMGYQNNPHFIHHQAKEHKPEKVKSNNKAKNKDANKSKHKQSGSKNKHSKKNKHGHK